MHISSGVWGVEYFSRGLTDYVDISGLGHRNHARIRLTIMNDPNSSFSLELIRNRIQIWQGCCSEMANESMEYDAPMEPS